MLAKFYLLQHADFREKGGCTCCESAIVGAILYIDNVSEL